MGGCASTQTRNNRSLSARPATKEQVAAAAVITVVHADSGVEELKPPICAAQILSQHPSCFLCSADSMLIDSYPTHVPEPEELKAGHLYFLMPKSQAHKPLSLENLCELAIKASSNLGIHDLQLSFRHCAL